MKKSRTTEYIIMDSKKNKDLLTNDIIKLQKVKHKRPSNDKPPKPKPPVWFVEFEKRNNQRFDNLENDIKTLKNDFSILKDDFNKVIKLNNLKY